MPAAAMTSAGYASAAGYAPAVAYAVPTTVNYAPPNSYAVTPAGSISAGSEAAAYLGQSTPLNYVPPQFTYRTTYAAVPVYMYRPVTAYNPVTGQPTTCLQPVTTSQCQPQRERCFSIFNPFTWFSHSSCRPSGCGAPPATTAYCCNTAQCGQPYYPTQPAIPVVPAPAVTVPSNVIPAQPGGVIVPQATPTIPSPPTRVFPGPTGTTVPADLAPRIIPGTTTTPAPSGTFTPAPSGTFTPAPATAIPATPGGVTPISPGVGAPPATSPGGSFPTTPGTFGTGANYPPPADPYTSTLTPASAAGSAPAVGSGKPNASPAGPSHSVFGSGYRGTAAGSSDARPSGSRGDGVIRAPELRPALPPSVQTVPDLDAPPAPRPGSRAPQLLDPRDKTAVSARGKWAVVPAIWPAPASASRAPAPAHAIATVALERQPASRPAPAALSPNLDDYDDRGWKSAR
jgi:hypothetical protein